MSSENDSNEEEVVLNKSTKSSSKKKNAPTSSSKKRTASSDDEDESSKKKQKVAGRVINDDGSEMYELGNNRFISVSDFKGKTLVNIREYYEKDGKLNPGKKGISLTRDQYLNLKKMTKVIDELLNA